MTQKLYSKIYTGDCARMLKRFENDSIDLTVTSPPYDKLRTCYRHEYDFETVAAELFRVTKPGGVVVWIIGDQTIDGSETGTSFRNALAFKDTGFRLYDTMIWSKMAQYPTPRRYQAHFEYMFILSKGWPKTANIIHDRKNIRAGEKILGPDRQQDGSLRPCVASRKGQRVREMGSRFNIWNIPSVARNPTGHPGVFPVTLAQDHILSWSNPGEFVLDPFAGSGTTGVACRLTGRHFVGIEIDAEYARQAIKRISETPLPEAKPHET